MTEFDHVEEGLIIALSAAVPLYIREMRDWTAESRIRSVRGAPDIVGSQGDLLQFHSKKRGETAKVFNALARGIAVGAYQPGGVTFGRSLPTHWCVYPHPGCPQQRGRPAPSCCVCDRMICPITRGEDGHCPSRCRWCRNGCSPECPHLTQSHAYALDR